VDGEVGPALALLVSGGHTQLVLVKSIGNYQLLGETRDDAAGECFDKVARLLNLGYPGGPIISELAKLGDSLVYELPIPMKDDPSLDFSFSGLKTACKYFLQQHPLSSRQQIQDFCASFQATIVNALLLKTKRAINLHQPKSIWLGGGVGANWQLRRELRKLARRQGLPLLTPYSNVLFTDNAAMIGIAAYFKSQRSDFVKDLDSLDRLPNLSL
jgi:N6-L-threonylcarbamoyladenine synthase